MSSVFLTTKRLSQTFQEASEAKPRIHKKNPAPPFSLRLTYEERAWLDQQAGGRPLGAYIRKRLLGERAEKRRIVRKPKADEKQIALVLAELGRSRLSSNLNQLARAANIGALEVSPDVEQELRQACGAILEMRDTLISALNLKPEG